MTQDPPYLERLVSINVQNQPLSEVFKMISNQTSVVFSYNQFDDQQKISKKYTKRPLRLVLSDLFLEIPCEYKIKGKYIILRCTDKKELPAAPSLVISGYVYDAIDSTSLANSSIYIRQNKSSTLSDQYGYFSLNYSHTQQQISLSVAKENYKDTTWVVLEKDRSDVIIYLYPKKKETQPIIEEPPVIYTIGDVDTTRYSGKSKSLYERFLKGNRNSRNITDTLFSNFAVSLFPPVSTNKLLSINTRNKFAFNLLVGHSKGIDYAEIGGLLNIDNGDVRYAQIAGLGNTVSGNMDGFQVAGLINTVNRNVSGVQAAGILNAADTIKGVQISGLINSARVTRGVQIAGLVNRTGTLEGSQIALINLADKSNGIPIGLLSIVRKGYHKIEFTADELSFGTFAVRTGVNKFHNIFLAGYSIQTPEDLWSYGYGIGSSIVSQRYWALQADFTTRQIQGSDNRVISLNLLNRAFLGVDFRPTKWMSIGVGPSFNTMIAHENGADFSKIKREFGSTTFYNETFNGINYRMWIGGSASLKFF